MVRTFTENADQSFYSARGNSNPLYFLVDQVVSSVHFFGDVQYKKQSILFQLNLYRELKNNSEIGNTRINSILLTVTKYSHEKGNKVSLADPRTVHMFSLCKLREQRQALKMNL